MDEFTYQHFRQWADGNQVPEHVQNRIIVMCDNDPEAFLIGWPLLEECARKQGGK